LITRPPSGDFFMERVSAPVLVAKLPPIVKGEPGLAVVEPGLSLEGVTKSEIEKCATETGPRNAAKRAVCSNLRRAADARLPPNWRYWPTIVGLSSY